LTLPENLFIKELEVVKEERRLRTDDNPQSLSYEQLFATAFNNGAYRNPVIGWMSDLEKLRIDDLRRWYASWYAPNNAILVVVGDVNPEHILKLAQKHYGPIPSRELSKGMARKESPQRGERRVKVKAPAELPYIVMGFKTPILGQAEAEWEAYALEVLSGILDGGRSSRLSKHLVRERELAASVGAGYSIYGRYPGLFIVDGVPAQGHTISELEQALVGEIETLRDELVSESELKRVKAQVVASEVYARDSISRQASLIGSVETIGLGWKVLDNYVPNIQAVTAEQVREVARKYLIEDSRTVVVLEPLPIDLPQANSLGGAKGEA
jgi:zinc protease